MPGRVGAKHKPNLFSALLRSLVLPSMSWRRTKKLTSPRGHGSNKYPLFVIFFGISISYGEEKKKLYFIKSHARLPLKFLRGTQIFLPNKNMLNHI